VDNSAKLCLEKSKVHNKCTKFEHLVKKKKNIPKWGTSKRQEV